MFSRYLSFCLHFLVMQKNGLIRNMRIFSDFMTLHPRSQTSTTQILLDISRINGNRTIKFGQLMEYNKKMFFFRNRAENKVQGD